MNTVSDLTTLVHTGDVRIDSLLDSVSPWNFLLPYRNTLYYTFDASDGSYIDDRTSTELTEFNSSQQNAAREILGYVSGLIGVSFVEVGSSAAADIHFGGTDLAGGSNSGLAGISYNYSHSNGNLISLTANATIWLDNVEFAGQNDAPLAGNAGYETLLHEIGHMLGLGHSFNSPNALSADLDNTNNTVMSYTFAGSDKSSFQAFDLWALTWIYGGDGLAGNWGYNSVNGFSLNPGAEDISAPTIQNFTPVDNAAGVAVNTEILIAFDEPIARGSGSITLKTAAGQTVEVFDAATSTQLELASTTLTITPSSLLSEGTEYLLELDAGSIEDLAGNPFEGSTSYNFTTLPATDVTAPEIDSFSPVDGAASVALDPDLVIQFNENITAGSGSLVLRTEGGATIAEWDLSSNQNSSISGDTLTIALNQNLDYATHYILEVPAGSIKDLAGNDFAGSSSYDFTTIVAPDNSAPVVTQFSPADNSSAVAISSSLRVYFNEPIKPGAGTIVLQTASGLTVETFDADTSSKLRFNANRLTISPSTPLENSTEYRLVFSAGAIEDLSGNPSTAFDYYNFTTVAPDQPPDDFAGDQSTTGVLAVDGEARGDLETAGDTDWFRLELSAGGNYLFELSGNASGGGSLGLAGVPLLALLNGDGEILASATDGSPDSEPLIRFQAPESGTFYLSAEGQGGSETGTYSLFASIAENNTPVGLPFLFGDAVPGATLLAEIRAISDADGLGEFSFQWLRNGAPIAGATESTYSLQEPDLNKAITVQVNYTDGAGFDEMVVSGARLPSAPFNDAYTHLIEMYVLIPGRAPDPGGLAFWSSQIDNGISFEEVAEAMWNSPGAQALYPVSMSDEEKVATVYRNVLAREPDEEGLNFWLDHWQNEEIGPSKTMLAMIESITANNTSNPTTIGYKVLFEAKVDIGGYLAVSLENEDVQLGRDAFSYLESGYTVEQTIDFIDLQLEIIGQPSTPAADDLLV